MDSHPLDETFDKVVKGLQNSVNLAMLHLKEGIQAYLSDNVDISQLLKVIEKLGLFNIIGMTETPIPGLDYYQVLGLEKTASNSEIKKRYLEIMIKIHPDRVGQEMTFLSSLVNTAYQIISKERGI